MHHNYKVSNMSYSGSSNADTFLTSPEDRNFASIMTIFRISLALILRAGFVLIQFGSVPTESFYDLLLQNVVEFSVSTTSYGLLGAVLSFGKDSYYGIFGYGPWDYSKLDSDNVVVGFCAVLIGSAIITTFLSSRLHFFCCAVVALVYGGIFQPILMHWIWHENGWMHNMNFIKGGLKIRDHGGSVVIHTSSGCIGLMGAFFLGRRLLRLNDVDDCSLGAESPTTIFMGYIFVMLGLIGFSLPTKMSYASHTYNYVGVILTSNLLALAGGSVAAIVMEFMLCRDSFNYWVILRCAQGCVAGLVVMSSSVDVCSPPISFAIALAVTMFQNLASKVIHKLSVEDYCNVTTTHLLSGLWSCALNPIITKLCTTNYVSIQQTFTASLWHIFCLVVVLCCSVLLFNTVFLLLRCAGLLRNRIEDNCHQRSKKLSKNLKKCAVYRFFMLTKRENLLEPGGFGKIAEDSSDVENNCLVEGTSKHQQVHLHNGNETAPMFGEETVQSVKSANKIVPSSSSTATRKEKHIYTMRNCDVNAAEGCTYSFGDAGDPNSIYKLDDLIRVEKAKNLPNAKAGTNSSRIKIKIGRRMSHHKLNKSRRFVDLPKHKLAKKASFIKNKNSRPIQFVRGQELIAYDKQYRDGIITIKMPTSKYYQNISD